MRVSFISKTLFSFHPRRDGRDVNLARPVARTMKKKEKQKRARLETLNFYSTEIHSHRVHRRTPLKA